METFRLPGTDDENYWAAPAHGSPIRAVRETVRYVLLPSEAHATTTNCHNNMVSASRGHPAAGAKMTDRGWSDD